jgi:hypothetical protein
MRQDLLQQPNKKRETPHVLITYFYCHFAIVAHTAYSNYRFPADGNEGLRITVFLGYFRNLKKKLLLKLFFRVRRAFQPVC